MSFSLRLLNLFIFLMYSAMCFLQHFYLLYLMFTPVCRPGSPKIRDPIANIALFVQFFFSLLASERGNFIHSDEIMSGCKKNSKQKTFSVEVHFATVACFFSKVHFNLTLIWPFLWQPGIKTPANKGHFQRFRALLFASLKKIFQIAKSFISAMKPSSQNP